MDAIKRGDRFRHHAFLSVQEDGRTGGPALLQVTKVAGDTIYWRFVEVNADGTERLGGSYYTRRESFLKNTREVR